MIEHSPVEPVHKPVSALSLTAVLNRGLPVHDWYLMPEAYSEPLIAEAINRFGLKPGDSVLDPFSGTGTTVVAAVAKGLDGIGLEVNPFLAFAARIKLDWGIDTNQFRKAMDRVLDEAQPLLDSLSIQQDLFTRFIPPTSAAEARSILEQTSEPEMPRLYEWMTQVVVHKILVLDYLITQHVPQRIRPHFQLALASILRPVSNMKLTAHAFGSQVQKEDSPVYELFRQKIIKICEDLESVQPMVGQFGTGQIVHTDARMASGIKSKLLPVSLAITSPPYLNNLDYTMQTRLELFFLRFVKDMADLRSLRKSMVTCDAKAMYKDVKDSIEVADVQSIQQIVAALKEAHSGKNWGWDYGYMTTQYFGGMRKVLRSVRGLLKEDARFVLIVGESVHSGVKVPLPEILAELGELEGYKCEEINVLRERHTSSHRHVLREAEVILKK